MKPWIHAESSAKKYGGTPDDYIEIHNLMDSSKAAMGDHRHRALTHNTWFVGTILEKIFGVTITNSDGKKVSVRDIGEDHVLEDFRMKCFPTAQDFLEHMEIQEWMMNGAGAENPSSMKKLKIDKEFKKTVYDGTHVNPILPNVSPGQIPPFDRGIEVKDIMID